MCDSSSASYINAFCAFSFVSEIYSIEHFSVGSCVCQSDTQDSVSATELLNGAIETLEVITYKHFLHRRQTGKVDKVNHLGDRLGKAEYEESPERSPAAPQIRRSSNAVVYTLG